MNAYNTDLLTRIYSARERAALFFENVIYRNNVGWLYTTSHNVEKYPAAILYGTWSGILGLHLLKKTSSWSKYKVQQALEYLKAHRRRDGAFFPVTLENIPINKSREYFTLHCTNYSLGAALSIEPHFDFETRYMDRFLDGDYLHYWLEARSLLRPWEEGNNIVNVASYLALMNDCGDSNALLRLGQMLDWHRKNQNPKTGGFDGFLSPSYQNRLESLAGAVHNFHLHLYLGKEYGFENQIAQWVEKFLVQGQLSACESIDFVELAVRTIDQTQEPQRLVDALIIHLEALLRNQRQDGGWTENANNRPTVAAGFVDNYPSSCSYATWFRLASIGMIAITLLGDSLENWCFRKTLGMGYSPNNFPTLPASVVIEPVSFSKKTKIHTQNFPKRLRKTIIDFGVRVFN